MAEDRVVDAVEIVDALVTQGADTGRGIAAGRQCAEGEAVLEVAGLVAKNDPAPLHFLEQGELRLGPDPHLRGSGFDAVLERSELLIEQRVGSVGDAGEAGLVVRVRLRLLLAVGVAGGEDLDLVERERR
jgi:hypothetical protein